MTPLRFFVLLYALGACAEVQSFAKSSENPDDSVAFRQDVERLFVDAMRHFTAGQFDSAASLFARHIREFPRSHRSTGCYIMGAKAFHRLGSFRESIKLLKDLIDLYPESKYVDDAHYTLGLNFYRLVRYEDAAEEFLQAYQLTDDPRLRNSSLGMLETLTSAKLSAAQLQLLLGGVSSEEVRALVDLRIAEKVYASGDVRSAQEMLRSIAARAASIKYVGDAITLLQKYEQGGIARIGVVLPLMLKAEKSSAKELGIELLDGIRFATDEHNQESLPRVELDIRDSERDPSVAARQVAELCGDEKVVSIFGPVFSNEVFASAGIANARGVPLISPTATANGIAAIGGFVFQANPDYEVRGRAMARYAVQTLHDSTFAVLSPVEPPGKLMADAFIDEVMLLGARIVDVQWYPAGATDLRMQLESMRKKALEASAVPYIDFSNNIKHSDVNRMVAMGISQRMLDSLMEVGGVAPVDLLFGRNGKLMADSLGLETQKPLIRADSLGLPVENIQAIFVPISSSEEIGVVGSQLKLFNFRTQVLGTGEWQDPAELDQHRQYVDGVIFSTDSDWDEKDPVFKLFIAKFQKAEKRKPTRNTLYGYDAMKLLLKVIQLGATHRNEIAANLAAIQDFPGIHSKVSFGERRVNSFLAVLQFKNRMVKRLGDVDVSLRPSNTP
ncbi:MAG: ABC transporter substrate-binding protein [Ignavibacteriales bacterium]|nr:ABC transporter substrate-binding protein [Ignavibacteriales bacterium]